MASSTNRRTVKSRTVSHKAKPRRDVYETITNQIIAAIEAGTGPLVMPWYASGVANTRPTNISSGNAYRGVNTIALWTAAHRDGYSKGLWGTYRQWLDLGAQVRKGEKSTSIVFFRNLERDEEDRKDDESHDNRNFVIKVAGVFNVDQVDGYEPPEPMGVEQAVDPVDPIVAADVFIQSTGATVWERGNRAFYNRREDAITMPDRWRFADTATSSVTERWYSVLLHELTHWVGAPSRMDREFGKRFGDDAYAMEELVAEMGSAFLCADLGITAEPRPDHAAYIDHWLRIMKSDSRAVFTAASAAAKAVDFLVSLQSQETSES